MSGGGEALPVSFEFPIIYVGTGKVADFWIHSILCVQHNHWVMVAVAEMTVQPLKQGQVESVVNSNLKIQAKTCIGVRNRYK